ncbi:hypothetical protein NW754_008838 [Fusarium falciforme]|uniref:Uncharacterized protein n=1 Tax=Fusarium falciforme TaxID=195108 RepID=A0A9W8RBT2_9HYPO|nr:hypothetical protein NW754_008838 [Fusarium falciforme]KAJ4191314.1 hypothetical protein NW755_004496 [Fusarium falciforme]
MLREVAPPALPNEVTYDASSGSVLEANDLPHLIARYCTPLHLFEFQHAQLTDFLGYPKESPPVQVGTGVQEPGSGSRREGPVSVGNGVTLRKSGEMEIEAIRCRVSCCNVAVTTALPSLGEDQSALRLLQQARQQRNGRAGAARLVDGIMRRTQRGNLSPFPCGTQRESRL